MSARSAVASRKAPDNTPEPNLADAAEKASLVIRSLQARLQQRSPELAEENAEELERQLAQYFSKSVPLQRQPFLSDLRSRVVDAVAERILRCWEHDSPLEAAVIDRMIERLFERLV